ncbi:MAG: DUF4215 domain-containing protein, partial [Myxococcales bacterium]|nr:DUF4215 domain-containing protein [Myxococcales bacterium]
MHVTTRLTALAVTVLLSLTPAAHAGEEQLSSEQAGCIVAVNKAFAGVVNSAAKAAARCGRELASGAASLESCLAAANTAKAEAKTASAQQKKCEAKGVEANSTFAYIGDASAVNEAGVDETLAIATKLIGSATPDSSDAGRCQETVLKGVAKYASTLAKETVKQKKKSLKGKLGAPPETAGELAEDLGAAGLSAKVGAAAARMATKTAKKCAEQDLGALFPGGCGATSSSELAQCGEDLARCHFCRALNVADGLALDCAAYSGLATCGLEDGICGDGTVTGTEQCDDGNTTNGDGCDDQCVFESVCGDGALEGIEQCDDGNTTDGDGCSSLCIIEGVHICGDGEVSGAEQCDDGNTTSGDGCSSACVIEEMHVCGDGEATGSEECDDGNTANGDGCDENCVFEIVEPFCGDGTLDPEEQCDDGNTGVGDGCDQNCLFEVCGNGVLQNGETCDDGNQTSGDGCSDVCQLEIAPVCGNGVPEAPEECDDGNTVSGDGCSNVCLIEIV